ncbi:response regulator transcription factor [Microbacterium sp. LTA6]|uniref:response regulator transcription factor n=1 Tax=unclassified Microbacterium TaxID=2609290 RepID=UPI0031399D17
MRDVRVLIVDDEALVRRALTIFVDTAPSMHVVGEAQDGPSAVARCLELQPDVVLMDLRMPGGDGLTAIRQLGEQVPGTRVIAVTTYSSDDAVIEALNAGAVGFLVKDTEPDQIVSAIRNAQEGGYVLSPSVAQELVRSVSKHAAVRASLPLSASETVSQREQNVIQLLADGMSNAEIAQQLFLSEATVKSHLRRIMTKWNVRDRVQVLVKAAKAGLVDIS